MCIDFNPRLREGGDIICIVGNSCIVNFNPRLREGGDKIDILFPPNKRYFNPRLREGGDVLWILLWILWITISIHASAKEATFPLYLLWMGKRFQSTPPRRRRPSCPFHASVPLAFQSTPPRRRRPQHIVIPQLSCTYLVSTTFLSTFFSFISQYVVLFFLF